VLNGTLGLEIILTKGKKTMSKKQDELRAEVIAAFKSKIRETVEQILEEKLREAPGLLELIRAGTAEAERAIIFRQE
jgi:hypothetical protein